MGKGHLLVNLHHVAGMAHHRGHILHDILEARVMPDLVGPVGPGTLHFTAIWKASIGNVLTQAPSIASRSPADMTRHGSSPGPPRFS